MISFLIELDKVLFFLFNVYLANPVTNLVMPIITNDNLLRLAFAAMVIVLLLFGNKRTRWLALFSIATLVITDQLSAGLLKGLIARPRPCHVFTDINLLVTCGGGYSMPSSHAANVFGQAFLLSRNIKHIGWPLFIFAILVASSRVFVGVHYPGDVLGGFVIGAVAGLFVSWLYKGFIRIIHPVKHKDNDEPQGGHAESSEESHAGTPDRNR
jgi:undecaprenyl-diphosphatase